MKWSIEVVRLKWSALVAKLQKIRLSSDRANPLIGSQN